MRIAIRSDKKATSDNMRKQAALNQAELKRQGYCGCRAYVGNLPHIGNAL